MPLRPAPSLALAALLSGLMAGCALQTPPSRSDLQRDALPHTVVPPTWKADGKASGEAIAPLPAAWLATFNDPALLALVAASAGPQP